MTKSFGAWLKAYKGDDPIGDLRDDFLRDARHQKRRPSTYKMPTDLQNRMYTLGACSDAMKALREAADLFGKPLPAEDEEEDDA